MLNTGREKKQNINWNERFDHTFTSFPSYAKCGWSTKTFFGYVVCIRCFELQPESTVYEDTVLHYIMFCEIINYTNTFVFQAVLLKKKKNRDNVNWGPLAFMTVSNSTLHLKVKTIKTVWPQNNRLGRLATLQLSRNSDLFL